MSLLLKAWHPALAQYKRAGSACRHAGLGCVVSVLLWGVPAGQLLPLMTQSPVQRPCCGQIAQIDQGRVRLWDTKRSGLNTIADTLLN